jgi:hypothetical protein
MRSREQVVSMDYSVDKKKGKAVVIAKLSARIGREATVHMGVADARQWLSEQGVEAGVLVSGNSIHNSMDRRLGLRTEEDLETTFVFELAQSEPVVVEEATEVAPSAEVEAKAKAVKPVAPRRTRAKKSKTGDKE